MHPLRRLGEQRHVRVGARARDVVVGLLGRAPPHARLVGAVRARGDVRLDADDRLDAGILRGLVELERREGVAVVGDRDRRHALADRLLDERADAGGPVEHRVLAVHVQVNEGVGCHGSSLCSPCDAAIGRARARAIASARSFTLALNVKIRRHRAGRMPTPDFILELRELVGTRRCLSSACRRSSSATTRCCSGDAATTAR